MSDIEQLSKIIDRASNNAAESYDEFCSEKMARAAAQAVVEAVAIEATPADIMTTRSNKIITRIVADEVNQLFVEIFVDGSKVAVLEQRDIDSIRDEFAAKRKRMWDERDPDLDGLAFAPAPPSPVR